MMIQEFSNVAMQDRRREAAELQRQHKAETLQRQGATPRGGLSTPSDRLRRLPLPSFMARVFRTASAP